MAIGRKTGGRKAGKPNQKTQELADKLAALKCDPIEGMARIAMDKKNDVSLRGKMFSELAKYVHPQRKSIDHTHKPSTGSTLEELLHAYWSTEK